MQKLPIITNLNELDIKKVQGQSIFDFYKQIEKILQQQSNKELSLFFAEPIVNNVRGEITWVTKAAGEIRKIADIQPDERTLISEKITVFYDIIKQTTQQLENMSGAKSLGVEALKNLLITPDLQKSLFIVGDNLVIAEWACIPYGVDPIDYDLIVLDKKISFEELEESSTLQSNVEKESVFEPSPEILTVTSEEFKPSSQTYHTDTSSEPEKSNTEEDKDSLWRWLVISLLFLLLLVGLSLKGCSYVNVIVATNQQNSEQQLRNEIKELWTKIQEKSDSCTLSEAEKQKSELPQIPITPPVEPVEQEKKQGSEFPIPPQPTIAPLNEEALEKKDISVFSGAWLMTSDNLFDSNTDEKIKIAFIFDNVGNGKSGVIKNGGSRCISDSTVVIDSDKQFSISPLKLSCDDGHSITLAGENGNPLPCKLNGTDKAICYIECGTNNDLTVCPTDFARENI